MPSPDAIFAAAEERGRRLDLPYAGAVTPAEAHALQSADAAVVVDARTAAEWAYVGRIPGALELEWQSYPTMEVNHCFLEELRKLSPPSAPALFICRSGARSHHAAAAAATAGYRAYNVLEGFEGDIDADGHRNVVNGWRARGLPWSQT